jgi:hypothetical protein
MLGMILKFTGHSDDIICVESIRYFDDNTVKISNNEISAEVDGPTKILVGSIGHARACIVYAHYDGCWHFSVSRRDEGIKLPPWRFEIHDDGVDNDYTVELVVDGLKANDALVYERINS